ncbi:MAG TPA: hypothetical protein VMV57_03860, partial [Terracidiphilus sp.]|nr:hypothetical protein [Terracidiphilus sp.]
PEQRAARLDSRRLASIAPARGGGSRSAAEAAGQCSEAELTKRRGALAPEGAEQRRPAAVGRGGFPAR